MDNGSLQKLKNWDTSPAPNHGKTDELQHAIENIENFTRHAAKSTIPNLYDLTIEGETLVAHRSSRFTKMMRLTGSLLASSFSEEKKAAQDKQRTQLQQKLRRSAEIIKDHHFVLEKYRRGTLAQQRLAEAAFSVIHRFNTLVSEAEHPPLSLRKWLACFLYERTGWKFKDRELSSYKIILPSFSSFSRSLPSEQNKLKTFPLLAFQLKAAPISGAPTTQEKDAFRMKAITMIKNHNPSRPIKEAMHQVREAPITPENRAPSPSVISFHQTLIPLPGEVIRLEGSFKRNPSSIHSVPIPTSFRLSSASTQSGFPYPSQHHGWALSDKLFPVCPHRLGLLPHLQTLFKQKEEIARELLPEGILYHKAKQKLELKKQIFDRNKAELLALHQSLSLAITALALPKELAEGVLKDFYHLVETLPSPFSHLSHTYQTLNELCIQRPFERLQEEWLEKKHRSLYAKDVQTRYTITKEILQNEIDKGEEEIQAILAQANTSLERATGQFILLFSRAMRSSVTSLLLQQMSEKLEFTPPLLTPFAMQLQAASLIQMKQFFDELNNDEMKEEILLERLKSLINADIILFKSDHIPMTSLVREIAGYYNMRHQEQKK